MNKYFTLLIIIISSFSLNSQSFKEMMTVRPHELQMKKYDKDSTANALVLYEYGTTSLNRRNSILTTEIHKKIKILNKNGLDKGNISIVLFGNKHAHEALSNISADTHNIEDSLVVITKLEKNQVYVEDFDGLSRIVKFTLPKVKAGSVITYSYKFTTPFIFNLKEWYFQEDIPKVTSEYLTSIPKDWTFKTQLVGNLKFTKAEKVSTPKCISESYNNLGKTFCENILFKMDDIPAFKTERFISSEQNYISKLDYELESVILPDGDLLKISNNWDLIDEQINESNDKLLKENRSLKKILPKTISNIENPKDRAKAIYNYVLQNYAWNGKLRSKNDDYKTIKKDKTGSIYEINGLLYNLLALNNIDALPMLISTRDNGLPTKLYPVITDFNYLIVRAKFNDGILHLDASDRFIPFGELPFRDLNQYGRVLNFKDASFWEDIEIKDYATNQKNVTLNLNKNYTFNGTIKSNITGFASHDIRQIALQNKDVYIEAFRTQFPSLLNLEHIINTTEKADKSFSEVINFDYELDFIDGKSYFNPFITKFFEENPFQLKARTYPTDFGYKEVYQYNIQIKLNDKVKVSTIPESVTIALPDNTGNFVFSCKKNKNAIIVYLKIAFNKAIYGPEYYEALKIFMSKVVQIQNNSIIILEKL